MEHFSPMNSGLPFHLPLDDKATIGLCSCPRRCLFWTSPLSHVKQWFVRSTETPTVMITFPVCHTDPLWCCLFWLYWDNGRLLCLIRVPGSGSTLFSLALSLPPHPSFSPLSPSSCTLLRRRWWGHWHSSAHLIQLLQKQRECSSADHDMYLPRGSGRRGKGKKESYTEEGWWERDRRGILYRHLKYK